MQGTRFDWRRIIRIAIPIIVLALTILFDQLTKYYFKNLYFSKKEDTIVIPDFFYFTYAINTGAAWSFLNDVAWAQTFYKVLTVVALCAFGAMWFFSFKKRKRWLNYTFALIIGGTIGNFIDRISFNGVIDFIGVYLGDYPFPIFNLADSFLVVGMIMLIVYFLFLDSEALFRRKKKQDLTDDCDGKEEVSDK
jgi:signal peptidase II